MDFRNAFHSERGEALVGYALVVVLVAVGSVVAVRAVGLTTESVFDTAAASMASPTPTTVPELTPDEKWDKAKADRDAAIKEAKERRDAAIEDAKSTRNAAVEENKSLPKAERQAANKAANETRNAAIDAAKADYGAAVSAANAARDAAKAEWQASKKK